MKHLGPFIDAIILIVILGLGIALGYAVTTGWKDHEIGLVQHKLDEAQLSLDETKAELAANHVVVLAWDELASYYTEASSGDTRSDGKPYDENQFIVAHRVIKNGTFLMIENPESGKVSPAVVRDWGPHPKTGRSLDVSLAVAKRLGIIEQGVAKLRCYLMVDGRLSKGD